MRRSIGVSAVNDDEWYTPRATADGVAAFAAKHLGLGTPILCPADLLPDGTESEIPKALRAAGFTSVRVTRNLPIGSPITDDYKDGEVVITNPPFSLLTKFRDWAGVSGAHFIVLARPGVMRRCWTITGLGDKFKSTDGRSVAAAWFQNLADTSNPNPAQQIGNCLQCERKGNCPNNEMTGGLNPGQDRPLYGWGHAVNTGVAGWHCQAYSIEGRSTFTRFFHGSASGALQARAGEAGDCVPNGTQW